MTLDFFRQRLVRIITRPPEFLYALTRHWFLMASVALIGLVILWVVVLSERPVYRGQAQLLLNPADPALPTVSSQGINQGPQTMLEVASFLNAQAEILRGESVLREMVKAGMENNLYPRDPAVVADDSKMHWAQRVVRDAKRKVSELLLLRRDEQQEKTMEELKEELVDAFERRSEVQIDPKSNTMDLIVYGTVPTVIESELENWITAFRNRIDDMAKTSSLKVLEDRSGRVNEREKTAKESLDEFRANHENVSESRLEFLSQQITELQIQRSDVRRLLDSADLGARPVQGNADPVLTELLRQRSELEMALNQELAEGYPETSSRVAPLREQLAKIEKEIEEREPSITQPPENRKQWVADQLASLTEELTNLMQERVELSGLVKELRDLEARYERARQDKESFELTYNDFIEVLNARSTLRIKTSDEPTVDTRPYNYHPLRNIALGALGGLAIGAFLSILREVFCGKVRFKHDLSDDLGLPVIAVLPK